MSKKKTKKANSLIEVLIVLGIISTTMVAAVNLIVKNLNQIKINEIEDVANGIMIEGMEIAKSPKEVAVSSSEILNAPINNSLYFSLDNTSTINVLKIQSAEEIESCTENSKYLVESNLENTSQNFRMCLQIEITPLTGPNNIRYYEITSRIIYKLPGGESLNTVRGYRYAEFQVI